MDRKPLEKVKKDLAFIMDIPEVHSVLLFGSYVTNEETPRSDIDICVIVPNIRDEKKLLRIYGIIVSSLSTKPEYDVSIFEMLPLYMKGEVIESHIVLFSRDELDLYEYLYFYRKLWNDQKYRQKLTNDEMIALFKKEK